MYAYNELINWLAYTREDFRSMLFFESMTLLAYDLKKNQIEFDKENLEGKVK